MKEATTGIPKSMQYTTSPCLWGWVSVFLTNETIHNNVLSGGRDQLAGRMWAAVWWRGGG